MWKKQIENPTIIKRQKHDKMKSLKEYTISLKFYIYKGLEKDEIYKWDEGFVTSDSRQNG